MARQLFTAADIRRIARVHKSELLVLSPADLITPEAVDLARELGVRQEGAPTEGAAAGSSHPNQSSITFGTRDHARFVYVALPADWNTG
jgi:hypothetical protein